MNKTIKYLIALSCIFFSFEISNPEIISLGDTSIYWLREITSGVSILFFITVMLISDYAPRILHEQAISYAMGGVLILSCVGIYVGPELISLVGYGFAHALLRISSGWISLYVILAINELSKKDIARILPASLLIGQLVAQFTRTDLFILLLTYCTSLILAYLLVHQYSNTVITATKERGSISSDQAARPDGYISLFSTVFLCMFIFKLANGYIQRLQIEAYNSVVVTLLSLIPLAILLAVVAKTNSFNSDRIFTVSFMLIIAGFLGIPYVNSSVGTFFIVLLKSGSTLFDAVFWVVIASLVARNATGAIRLFAWSRVVITLSMSVGAIAGYLVTHSTANNLTAPFINSFIIFICVAFAVTYMHRFSFQDAITGVAEDIKQPAHHNSVNFDSISQQIAHQYNLTPREEEVFSYLARGRNAAAIEKELFISRNTVASHITHIYSKLGIHTQQEAIDLVYQANQEAIQ